MGTSAWAADTAEQANGAHGGILSDPPFWVGVAFVIFLLIVGKRLVQGVTKLLDDRTALIARTLSEAEKLRDEAHKARDAAQKALDDSARMAAEIVNHANNEAQALTKRAADERTALIARREQQALDRIAQAEVAATRQVRDAAVDVALGATRTILREQVGTGRTAALIDEAIAELPRRQH
jgi:F-type H+-transporting ATPase subunit b